MTNFSKNQIEKAHPFSRFLNTSLGTLPWMWILVLSYLGFLLVLPISVLIKYSSQALVGDFWKLATTAKALSAYKVTLSLALLAATINGCFGFLVAWVLVRYNFPGKKNNRLNRRFSLCPSNLGGRVDPYDNL